MIEKERAIVAKFGGSSNADADRIKNTAEIVQENADRRFVILSAAGKRFSGDDKVTDLLLQVNSLAQQGSPYDEAFEKIAHRHEEIGRQLNCHSSVVGWLSNVEKGVKEGKGKDWTASRGEWLMANIFAKYAGGIFVNPEKIIKLKENGSVDDITYQLMQEQLTQNSVYVIPGFYGGYNGGIKIFARGGSDITGAIVARGVNARLYENWTDVDGVKAADPRLISHAKKIPVITFKEMRELGYRGADVLQMDSVLPVIEPGIPINLRNSFHLEDSGTLIVPKRTVAPDEQVIGIAGRQGYVSITIEKYGMNNTKGIAEAILGIFQEHDVSIAHDPSGLDSFSVICHQDELTNKQDDVIAGLYDVIQPDDITVKGDIGLVCIVGEGIRNNSTTVHKTAYQALDDAGIQVQAESYSTHGNSIVFAVEDNQVPSAIGYFYNSFIE